MPKSVDLDKLRSGDEFAWRSAMREHGRLVLAAARRVRLNPSDQEEAFQKTWLAAFRSIGTLRDDARFASWLYSIARRQSLDLAQKRRPELQSDERGGSALEDLHDPGRSTPDLLEELEEAAHLRRTVDAMDARCRNLLVALFLEDPSPSYEAICERLGMPIGSIGPTRARCLRKLQRLLEAVSERETRMSTFDETPGRSSELQKENG